MVNLSQKKRRLFLLLGQLFVLALCSSYIAYIYQSNILPDKTARASFEKTDCFLISKKLNDKSYIIDHFRAEFLISYNVNGVQYNHWVYGNGLDESFSQDPDNQRNILTRYDVGGTYPCWYDPSQPQIAFFVPRNNWYSIFPLLLPMIIVIFTLYFLAKNLRKIIIAKRWEHQFSPKKGKSDHH